MRRLAAAAAALLLAGCSAPRPEPSPPSEPAPPPSSAVAPEAIRYVALGDSAASAPLVPDRAPPTGCLKSTNNYPSVLARALSARLVDVTCSGARTPDLVDRAQRTFAGPVPPQLDAVGADTQLVTITIGGNDVDLASTASRCRRDALDAPPCAAELLADGDVVSAAITAAAAGWSELVDAVRARAPHARVVLVGYGTFIRPGGCFPAQPVHPADADYFQAKVDELDDRQRQVAADEGVDFFDVRTISAGHDMCAPPDQRWIEGFVLAHAAAPLHPNRFGAAAVGEALAHHLRR
ncbi:SGNH/GDSL hydrolase family protein [Mycobacterium sp. MYCO198283]|uniref:SGNH/GDSL hydrolase family protein n=1 Tax=Mycobacterium sp. MYCO198283 TaxID=2883505 RepID=UPI001E4C7F4F|nr:SGNH/GDSL hydrolase family protein [Mycobacterium sp. MYCO198283]MCG5433866.1 SGNH/GDSL hydrolase family protein [Mycobacterium sp. MYCO198283]